jgi:hypothetical protein
MFDGLSQVATTIADGGVSVNSDDCHKWVWCWTLADALFS